MASRLASKCINWLIDTIETTLPPTTESDAVFPKCYTIDDKHVCSIGIKGAEIVFTPIFDSLKEANIKKRQSGTTWWLKYDEVINVLSKRF